MYTRIFRFFNKNNLFYSLQFGFRQNYSTKHALSSLTENIRKYLDEGHFVCRLFADLQKAFDTVNYATLLTKLGHYGVRWLAIDWSKSYLSDRTPFVSINGHDSNLVSALYGVPEGSVLDPLLFLIYIYEWLESGYKIYKVHHSAGDTDLLQTKLNECVNLDMKNLTDWLNANKISPNGNRTELLIFKHQGKKTDSEVKNKLCGKRL